MEIVQTNLRLTDSKLLLSSLQRKKTRHLVTFQPLNEKDDYYYTKNNTRFALADIEQYKVTEGTVVPAPNRIVFSPENVTSILMSNPFLYNRQEDLIRRVLENHYGTHNHPLDFSNLIDIENVNVYIKTR